MTNESKVRLYISLLTIAMLLSYFGPFYIFILQDSHQLIGFNVCVAQLPPMLPSSRSEFLSYCSTVRWEPVFSFWTYISPYIPVGLLFWFDWVAKPQLRLSESSYPRRTILVLSSLGMVLVGIAFSWTSWSILSVEFDHLLKVPVLRYWTLAWLAFGWLLAPFAFHRLLAPPEFLGGQRKEMGMLLLGVLTPIAGFLILIIRGILEK